MTQGPSRSLTEFKLAPNLSATCLTNPSCVGLVAVGQGNGEIEKN
jgi:hypothetical protein